MADRLLANLGGEIEQWKLTGAANHLTIPPGAHGFCHARLFRKMLICGEKKIFPRRWIVVALIRFMSDLPAFISVTLFHAGDRLGNRPAAPAAGGPGAFYRSPSLSQPTETKRRG